MPLRLVAFGVLIVGLAFGVFLGARAIGAFPSPEATALVGQPIHIEMESTGLRLLVDDPSYSMDCEVADSTDKAFPITETGGSETVTINNRKWWVVAKTVEVTPPGKYTVRCTSEDPGLAYGVGGRSGVGTLLAYIFGALGSVGVGVVGFVGLFLLGLRQRRTPRPGSYTEY